MTESKLILPGGGDAAELSEAIERDKRDVADSQRGTRRRLNLLRARRFRTTPRSRLTGLIGYR